MKFKTLAIAVALLSMSLPALAEGPSYQPANNCNSTNFSLTTGAATEVATYEGNAIETRITIEGTGATAVRCYYGNVFGSTPTKPTTTLGNEIPVLFPVFDYYPFVPPNADTWCIAETGTPKVDVLRCYR